MATRAKTMAEYSEGQSPKRKAKVNAVRKKLKESPKPTSVVGSHLTVTTWPDGHTTLFWDDDALLRDVHAALQNK